MLTGNITKEYKKTATIQAYQTEVPIVVKTLEGDLTAQPGDYIATGSNGEQWPIRKDIFEETYTEVIETN